MRAIYQVALRIGLVRDEQNKLLGTVTDGDIRRGLLVNCEMQDSVGRVMNKAPIIAKSTRTVNNASIGKNSIINTGAIVEHDCKIGAHNHLAPGVTLSGGVMTASQVHIGTGASVIQNIQIGEQAVIGAGTTVVKNVPAQQTIIPAANRITLIKKC